MFKFIFKKIILFLFIMIPFLAIAEDVIVPIEFNGSSLLPRAQLYIDNTSGDIPVGSNFNVPIYINTQGKSINTVKLDMNFEPEKVSLVSSSGVDSIFGILFESPVYNNQSGQISITGIVPNGINTASGLITTLSFKALAVGDTTININDYSSANLNDGNGTNVILATDSANYNIIEGQLGDICIINPNDPSCVVQTFCELHPTDPACVAPVYCNLHPTDPVCTANSFCELNPNDPYCLGYTYCDLHPNDTACIPPSGDTIDDDVNTNDDEENNNSNNENVSNPTVNIITQNITQTVSNISNDVVSVLKTEEGETTSNVVSTVGVTTGAAISILTGLFANPLTLGELFLIPLRLWGLLLTAFGIRKKNMPWGTVYDSVTKQPLDPAYVVLFDLNGKEVATSITDLDGRYGFLVPPGKYKIVASKTNYEFPSKKLNGKNQDELYNELYFDEIIEIKEGGVISRNIPMDPLKFDWNEFAKSDKKLMKFFRKKDLWIARISSILFIVGFIVSVLATLVNTSLYNIIITGIYVLLFIAKRTIIKPRPFGYIRHKETKNPLSFAILHAYFGEGSNEITHKVADKNGKYYCLVPNGKYNIKIENKNNDGSYSVIGQDENIEVKRGYINKKFDV